MGMWTGIIGLPMASFVPGRLAQKKWGSRLGLIFFDTAKLGLVDSGRIVLVVLLRVGLAASL